VIYNLHSTGAGANTGTESITRTHLWMQRKLHTNALTCAQLRLSDIFLTVLGILWQHIGKGSLARQWNGCVPTKISLVGWGGGDGVD